MQSVLSLSPLILSLEQQTAFNFQPNPQLWTFLDFSLKKHLPFWLHEFPFSSDVGACLQLDESSGWHAVEDWQEHCCSPGSEGCFYFLLSQRPAFSGRLCWVAKPLSAIRAPDICSSACSRTAGTRRLLQLIFVAASSLLIMPCYFLFLSLVKCSSALSFCYLFLIALLPSFTKRKSQKCPNGVWI